MKAVILAAELSISEQSRVAIVLEELSVLGSLGSVITEITSEFAPVQMLKVGVLDLFWHHFGTLPDHRYLAGYSCQEDF